MILRRRYNMAFLTAKTLARRTVLRGIGTTLALPFLDAMFAPLIARGSAPRSRFTASRRSMCRTEWPWNIGRPKGEGTRPSVFADSTAAHAVSRSNAGALGLKASWNYIHAGASGSFLTGHQARRTQRGRDHRRRFDGPVAGAAFRERDAVGIARAVDGSSQQRRSLHWESELRLYAYAVVAQPDAAAADGMEPARGVREAVRR